MLSPEPTRALDELSWSWADSTTTCHDGSIQTVRLRLVIIFRLVVDDDTTLRESSSAVGFARQRGWHSFADLAGHLFFSFPLSPFLPSFLSCLPSSFLSLFCLVYRAARIPPPHPSARSLSPLAPSFIV
ncbi:hypothetical protein MAP00_000499 [Monascus purpureus]|nr:hypothetical protein MAP00_000499 [Monascus purpureus]